MVSIDTNPLEYLDIQVTSVGLGSLYVMAAIAVIYMLVRQRYRMEAYVKARRRQFRSDVQLAIIRAQIEETEARRRERSRRGIFGRSATNE